MGKRKVPTPPACRHCRKRPRRRTGGICYRCWIVPAIRAKYPPRAPRGLGIHNRQLPLDSRPTFAVPGSDEKIGVLHDRVRRGVGLWHPLDARIDD